MPDPDKPLEKDEISKLWFLGTEGVRSEYFKEDDDDPSSQELHNCGGVKEISFRYEFKKNKLRVTPWIDPAKGARVVCHGVAIYDFKNVDARDTAAARFVGVFDSKTTESKPRDFQAIKEALAEQVFSGSPYSIGVLEDPERRDNPRAPGPYIFDIGPDFDGRGLGIEIEFSPRYLPPRLKRKCKKRYAAPAYRMPFLIAPLLHEFQQLGVIFGCFSWMMISRSGREYRWGDEKTPVKYLRREDGKFISVADWKDCNKFTKEKFADLAIFAPFFLIKEKYTAEDVLGKKFLEDTFNSLKYDPNVIHVVEIPTWALALAELYRTEIYEDWADAVRCLLIALEGKENGKEIGFFGRLWNFTKFLYYSAWLLIDIAQELPLPGPKGATKARKATRRGRSGIEHVDVPVHTKKAMEKMEKSMDEYANTQRRRLGKLANQWDEEAKKGKKAIRKSISDTKKHKKMLKELYKDIDKKYPGISLERKKELMDKCLTNQDIPHLVQAKSLPQFLKKLRQLARRTPDFKPGRRMRAWVKWMELQNLPTRRLPLKFSKKVQDFLRRAKIYNDRLHLLLGRGRRLRREKFEEEIRKICKRSTPVKTKFRKITGSDLIPLWGRDGAWQRAYNKIPVEDRKYFSMLEGSGKSGRSFKMTGQFNDLDITINPDLDSLVKKGIITKTERERIIEMRKTFIWDVNEEYKKLTGVGLDQKGEGIFIYAGWGKGMCPYKKDEGWSDEARLVYNRMEQLITVPVEPTHGVLGTPRAWDKISRDLQVAVWEGKDVTPEIARKWIEGALYYFNKDGKSKWVRKTHLLLLAVFGEKKLRKGKGIYSEFDEKIVSMAQRIELDKENPLLRKHIQDYLMKHAGYPDVATKTERHVFVFPNLKEASEARRWAREEFRRHAIDIRDPLGEGVDLGVTLNAHPQDWVTLMHVQKWRGNSKKPDLETIEMLEQFTFPRYD